jgi:regulator of protease activity HflC (stomatin/prohibitin superfamily)
MTKLTVERGQRAVVQRDGTVLAVLDAGRHRLPWPFWRRRVDVVDVRERLLLVTGQEVAAADVPGVKVSAVARWSVEDPVAFLVQSSAAEEDLRLHVQLAVRDWAAAAPVEELVAGRAGAGAVMTASVAPGVARLGIAVTEVTVRDVVVPGELRRAALAVAAARQEGLAELERARAQTASMRALANGARVLEDHPGLLQLRTAQAAAENGGTVVVQLLPRQ